jgi:hypothetical protein
MPINSLFSLKSVNTPFPGYAKISVWIRGMIILISENWLKIMVILLTFESWRRKRKKENTRLHGKKVGRGKDALLAE